MNQVYDLNLYEGDPIISDDISYLKQEINILFDTRLGDLMGDSDYGTDYEKFLYEWQASNGAMERQMRSDLCQLDLRGFDPEVKVYFLKGSERDIAIIDVELTRQYEKTKLLYKIT